MTTIIMRKQLGSVEVAYDSQTTAGNEAIESAIEKVFQKGEMLIGVAGDSRICDAVMFMELEEPKPGKIKEWVGTYFSDKLEEIAKKVSTCEHEDCFCEADFQILVLSGDGMIIEIASDLSIVKRPDGCYAIGSGCYFALGALSVGATAMVALEIAASRDIYTGGKLHQKIVLTAVPEQQ